MPMPTVSKLEEALRLSYQRTIRQRHGSKVRIQGQSQLASQQFYTEVTSQTNQAIGTVAREAKGDFKPKNYVDGLGRGSQAETYVGMLTSNTCAIVEYGLGGKEVYA